jgi:chemotaxis protein methyltransferase CheR
MDVQVITRWECVVPERISDIELQSLMEAIHARYHYDFRDYAKASLRRRLRSAMNHFGCDTIAQLRHRIVHDSAAFSAMLNFLTIQVSDLFRDPPYYRALREQVIPLLKTYPSLKFWVAGCSAGEEAYSLAILLHEENLLERSLIYATDINSHALRQAESGVYALDRIARFTENHRHAGGLTSLSDYYTAAYDQAIFSRALRERIVFSDHSLATDTVFAEVQFISCRNVLIYFERKLQDRVLGLFREALCRKGFLGLGSKESLQFSSHADRFVPVCEDLRIYRKQDDYAASIAS